MSFVTVEYGTERKIINDDCFICKILPFLKDDIFIDDYQKIKRCNLSSDKENIIFRYKKQSYTINKDVLFNELYQLIQPTEEHFLKGIFDIDHIYFKNNSFIRQVFILLDFDVEKYGKYQNDSNEKKDHLQDENFDDYDMCDREFVEQMYYLSLKT